jgi:hypothetical protein
MQGNSFQWREYQVTINPYAGHPYFWEQTHAEGIKQNGLRTIWLDEEFVQLICNQVAITCNLSRKSEE